MGQRPASTGRLIPCLIPRFRNLCSHGHFELATFNRGLETITGQLARAIAKGAAYHWADPA